MNVLHVCANPKPVDESTSKQLAVAFFSALAEASPDVEVTNLDLYENPPPYVTMDTYKCFWYPILIDGYQATDKERELATYAYEQAEVVKSADVLVLTMPLWNASAPAIMKSWLDHVLLPGLLFEYEKNEIRPRHAIRKVVLLVASGEALAQDDARDALTPQITAAFDKIGVKDIVVAWADGQDERFHSDSAVRKELAIEAAQEMAEEIAEMAAAV